MIMRQKASVQVKAETKQRKIFWLNFLDPMASNNNKNILTQMRKKKEINRFII